MESLFMTTPLPTLISLCIRFRWRSYPRVPALLNIFSAVCPHYCFMSLVSVFFFYLVVHSGGRQSRHIMEAHTTPTCIRQVAQQPPSHLLADLVCVNGWLVARMAGETQPKIVFSSATIRANEGIHTCMGIRMTPGLAETLIPLNEEY
jgi:hypothetical protein